MVACVSIARDVSVVSRLPRHPRPLFPSKAHRHSPGQETIPTIYLRLSISSRAYHRTAYIEIYQYSTINMMQIFTLSAFFQLWLASLVAAAPVAEGVVATGRDNAWEYGTSGGIIGLIVLILDIIAFGKSLIPNRRHLLFPAA